MSVWLIFNLVAIASMPVAYRMARARGRSTELWLSMAMIVGPPALVALLLLGTRRAGKASVAAN